ncbi:MAG: hypothetical protein R6U97_09520 [Desulfosalsimonas sp.]
MTTQRNYILIETIKRLLRRESHVRLRKIISRIHAADLSTVFPSLSVSHRRELFRLIGDRQEQGVILSELDEDVVLSIIEGLSIDELAEILEKTPSDDAASFIKLLPQEQADEVLERIRTKGGEDVESLLKYPDDTAGGIMIPDFIALPEEMTAGEVISTLQSKEYQGYRPERISGNTGGAFNAHNSGEGRLL